MDQELEGILARADELLVDMQREYDGCLHSHNVTERARNLTHEVLEKLRSALDHTMRRVWEKNIAPTLSSDDRERARIYFPVTGDLNSFRSLLGRGYMSDLESVNKNLYDWLLAVQPFSPDGSKWLITLSELAAKGKHIALVPQKRSETQRITVTRNGAGAVSWTPGSVRFGGGVQILGASVDPLTQRIVPTPGVTERLEIWVSFILDGYGINALGFCQDACKKTRELIARMVQDFQL
jgi:hypothetical protein